MARRATPVTTEMARLAAAALVLLALVPTRTAAVPASLRDRVKENYKRVLELCKRGPQPRAIEVNHVLKGVSPSEVVLPRQTVLHRCDELACCGMVSNLANHRCKPQVETVTLHFYATTAGTRRTRSISHEFQNHTRCDCVNKGEER